MKKSKSREFGSKLSHDLKRFGTKSHEFLAYNEIPDDAQIGTTEWDLSFWSLILTDRGLTRLIERESMSHKTMQDDVQQVNLSGGDKITDMGLNILANSLPRLISISLENVFQISGRSLSKLVKSCNHLECINLSGCLGIQGTDVAILGQHACGLLQLKLSGCRQITPWAFMKIFEGCRRLKTLDISYCTLITDAEIKVLADCCSCLEEVNLKECRQVSDVGVLSLSKGCKHLLDINIGRSDLVSRVTDISLLSIAEECSGLTSLHLAGCEMVTDVGLSWIAKGCKNLSYINLSNCTKVTNGGIRHLGDECKTLQSIILTNVKKVSDVGFRYLAHGCSQLESLNASGLYKLTDGVQRDFGHEGLQLLGRSDCVNTMKRMNLHGCFQISNISLRALASMPNLQVLVLSGCHSLNSEGMSHVLKSCTRLSLLSLASCGECITNSILDVIASNLRCLKSLDLSDCVGVGRKGLENLSRCSSLVSLKLSGCKRLSNEAVLALGEGCYYPGLQELHLNRCSKIDDVALTWIVDSFDDRKSGGVTLSTLSLKGTKIRLRVLQALRHCFRYSVIKNNDVFFGFLALHRCNDRRVINEHGKRAAAAARIQAFVRACRVRIVVLRARDHHKKTKMSTRIASMCRGYLARSLVHKMRNERWHRRFMAMKLQCFVRVANARALACRLRYRRWRLIAPVMAVVLQKTFRGFLGRQQAEKVRIQHEQFQHLRCLSTLKIQSIMRMKICQGKRRRLKEENTALDRKIMSSSLKIQTRWRGKLALTRLKEMKLESMRIFRREHKAAKVIMRHLRTHHFRACLKRRVQRTEWLCIMAAKIQDWFRDRLLAAELKAQEELHIKYLKYQAAICIQNICRVRLARLVVHRLIDQRDKVTSLRQGKALIITSWCRMCAAREKLHALRIERVVTLKRRFIVQSLAVTQISSWWRGEMGRRGAKFARESRKSRWKQMWSESDQSIFFYNRVTGESRWRKPQELLDLDPRPMCGNCAYYDAQVECEDCGEFYCGSCWNAVHYGGKRKRHLFRSLYDYYGKRIDYGDGEFPSQWPSELEQDEISGWRIRVKGK